MGTRTYTAASMPAQATASAEEIRDVNTRYHDGAAAGYDAKWGIDFGPTGQAQVLGKLRKALGDGPPLSALAGDRRGHRLLQPEPAAGRRRRPRDGHRHLPRDARDPGRERRPPRPRRRDGRLRRRAPALRRRVLRPRLRPRGAAPPARPRPGLPRVPPRAAPRRRAVLRRRALAARRSHRPRAQAGRLQGLAAVAAPDARAARGARPQRRRRRQPRPRGARRRARVHPRAAARLRRARRARRREGARRGAAGQLVRLGEPHARGDGRPRHDAVGVEGFAFRGYLLLQRVDSRLLEPYLPPAIFYNLLVAARRPA